MASPKVDYFDLELAFASASYDFRHWLDRRSGEILSYDRDIAEALQRGDDLSDLPRWQDGQVKAAKRVLGAFYELPDHMPDAQPDNEDDDDDDDDEDCPSGPGRYVRIEPIPSDEAFRFMDDFIGIVRNERARRALAQALRGRHPFRAFKAVLAAFPAERHEWQKFQDQCTRHYIEQWARDHGLEIDRSQNGD